MAVRYVCVPIHLEQNESWKRCCTYLGKVLQTWLQFEFFITFDHEWTNAYTFKDAEKVWIQFLKRMFMSMCLPL